jgi:hypothetical protein
MVTPELSTCQDRRLPTDFLTHSPRWIYVESSPQWQPELCRAQHFRDRQILAAFHGTTAADNTPLTGVCLVPVAEPATSN